MTSTLPDPFELPSAVPSGQPVAPPTQLRLTPADLDLVVDEVIDRIEQRVVDELERRGRRNATEVF